MIRTWWYLIIAILLAAGGWIILSKRRAGQGGSSPPSASCIEEETAEIRQHYDELAPRYDRYIRLFERLFVDNGRDWVAARAHGEVLEIAVGTGRNLPYYAPDVRISGIDLSPEMLRVARTRAATLDGVIRLDVGDAQALNFPDESFDTVVCTLSLCTIPDPRQVLAEVKRVLRPDGRFVALEHVRSPRVSVRLLQRALNPVSVRFGGDHLLRDPLDDLVPLGFEIEQLERSKLGIMERVVARKPA